MAKTKGAHHRGDYHVRSRKLTAAAKADPTTRCWRCGLLLRQVKLRYPNRRVHWTAGHVNAGEAGGRLEPECSVCNYGHGARLGNRLRRVPARMRRAAQLNTSRAW